MALAIVVLTATAGSVAAAAPESVSAPSADAKKKCKIVKKRVHGHIKRVRVCTKQKPKPKPKPVKSVSLQLDTSHAASKAISAADGGTVATTAANGTKLTLTIPRDALVGDKTVTVTPVTALAGLPKGSRFFGGAQLAPEGTGLLEDVTLTIETPAASTAKHLRAVGWDAEGKNPYPYKARGSIPARALPSPNRPLSSSGIRPSETITTWTRKRARARSSSAECSAHRRCSPRRVVSGRGRRRAASPAASMPSRTRRATARR